MQLSLAARLAGQLPPRALRELAGLTLILHDLAEPALAAPLIVRQRTDALGTLRIGERKTKAL